MNPDITRDDVQLIDDGTLDTVLKIRGEILRFDSMFEYRDVNGVLDIDAMLDQYWDEIEDEYYFQLTQ